MNKPALWGAGALVGFIVGAMTRPTFLGMTIPFSVLTSSSPADADFKGSLWMHLILATLGGLVVAVVLGAVLAARRP